MSMQLIYWEDPKVRLTDDDFDEIKTVRFKHVSEIPALIENRPPHCTMISTEHSYQRKLRNGVKTNFNKEVWRGTCVETVQCSHCKGTGRVSKY